MLVEAERNVIEQLGSKYLSNYFHWLLAIPWKVLDPPSHEATTRYAEAVTEKDAHVVVSALEAGADFLVTLDKRLKEKVEKANLALTAVTPGEFIRNFARLHPRYKQLREDVNNLT